MVPMTFGVPSVGKPQTKYMHAKIVGLDDEGKKESEQIGVTRQSMDMGQRYVTVRCRCKMQ